MPRTSMYCHDDDKYIAAGVECVPADKEETRRGRRDERSFGWRDSGNHRCHMGEKLVSIGDDYRIENKAGQTLLNDPQLIKAAIQTSRVTVIP